MVDRLGGANVICFPVSHAYFFVGRGPKSIAKLDRGPWPHFVPSPDPPLSSRPITHDCPQRDKGRLCRKLNIERTVHQPSRRHKTTAWRERTIRPMAASQKSSLEPKFTIFQRYSLYRTTYSTTSSFQSDSTAGQHRHLTWGRPMSIKYVTLEGRGSEKV